MRIAKKKGDPLGVDTDEHPRATMLESLARHNGWCGKKARCQQATPAA